MPGAPTPTRSQHRGRGDLGETLVEIIVALSILAITVVSVMSAFEAAIGASARHQSLKTMNNLLRNTAEVMVWQIQNEPSPLYSSCASAYAVTGLPTAPANFAISGPTFQYWDGSEWSSSCTPGSTAPQQLTLTATGLYDQKETLSFVVADFGYTASITSSPAFTSSAFLEELAGDAFSYTVSVSGQPSPKISITSGSLPTGVTFVDNGDGTATLAGPATVPAGTYTFTIGANNSVGSPASQVFTLQLVQAPTFTSLSSVTGHKNQKWTPFTVTTTGGVPTPAMSYAPGTAIAPTIDALPPGFNFIDNGDGTATIDYAPGGKLPNSLVGTYNITIIANSAFLNTQQSFTITIQ
jgi:hypothetical protein